MVALVRVHCWPAGMASAPSSGQLVSRPDSPRPAQPATFGLSSIQSRAAGASGSPNRSSKRAGTGVRISLRRGARPQELLTMGVKGESVGARSPQREHADWAVPQKKRKFNPDSLIPGLPSLCNHTSFPSDLAHSAEFLGENYFVDKKHAFQIWHVWLDAISSEKLKDEHNTASRSNQFYLRNQKGKAKWFTYLCRLVPSVEPQGGGKNACCTGEVQVQGASDLWGSGHLLLPGGVGVAEPPPEGSVQGRHVGELPEPGLPWIVSSEAECDHSAGERASSLDGGASAKTPGA
ncbi:zinc finger protein 667 isoform X8 [Dasypus novemcinctus]|nr:zinc finger protein 667 isoform X4 [Dasypus novemcinctus]